MRIEYAREKEEELFRTLHEVANNKQEEIRSLIATTIADLREEIIERCAAFEFASVTREELEEANTNTRQKCAAQLQVRSLLFCYVANLINLCIRRYLLLYSIRQDLALSMLSSAIADKLVSSVTLLRESFVGTLERCLTTLEGTSNMNGATSSEDATNSLQASHALRQILNAAYQVYQHG